METNVTPVPLTVSESAIVIGVKVSLDASSENVIALVLPYASIVTVGTTAATVYNENEVVKHDAVTSLVSSDTVFWIPSNISHSESASVDAARMHWQYTPSVTQSEESSGIVISTGSEKETDSTLPPSDVILYSTIDVFS